MEYNLNDVTNFANYPVEFAMWMDQQGFIDCQNKQCLECQSSLVLQYRARFTDNVCLRCTNQECRTVFSVRRHSFFEQSKISLQNQMQLLTLFVSQSSVQSAARVCGLTIKTVSLFFKKCREVWNDELAYDPIVFTDNGEYEVDEAQIKQIKSVDGTIIPHVWVGGIVERATGKLMLYNLPDRSEQHVVSPIHHNIPHGSIVYTDELISYHNLGGYYYHYAVNHSKSEYERLEDTAEFGELNVHINTIEGVFAHLRNRIRHRSWRTYRLLSIYLRELMYRNSGRSLFNSFKIKLRYHCI